MTNTIVISGIIGLEVLADDVREQLKAFNGEPVDIEINSPGGLVVDGIEIFNLLRMYKGNVTARIMGLAGSMASIIPMAANKVEVFDNSVFFIHLALTAIRGNKNMLRNEADILEGFDRMLINALAKKSGKEYEDLEKMMEKETFFFGEGIKENGFADVVIATDEETDLEEQDIIANAKAQFYAAKEKIKDLDPKLDKVAAYLELQPFSQPVKRPAFSNIQAEEKRMDKNKIKAEYPDVYESILEDGRRDAIDALKDEYIAEGKAAGILAERNRLEGIDALSMPKEFAEKAKAEGWTPEQSAVEYMKAEAVKKKEIAAKLESDVSQPLASDAPELPSEPQGKDEPKTPEQEFSANAELQAEFGGDFDRYKAFLKAESEGRAKILNKGGK